MQVRKTYLFGRRAPQLLPTKVVQHHPGTDSYTVRVWDQGSDGAYGWQTIHGLPAPGAGKLSGRWDELELIETDTAP